jgi:hypothetical protein
MVVGLGDPERTEIKTGDLEANPNTEAGSEVPKEADTKTDPGPEEIG